MSETRFAVILAGGVGSRFWPLSTPSRPKQLLPLVTERSMLEDTVDRLEPLVGIDHILILTSALLGPTIRSRFPRLRADQVLEEPRAAGTAAALAWASSEVRLRGGPEAQLISVHADAAIGNDDTFRTTLSAAADAAARHSALCLVGIVPTEAHPGLGYIQPGDPLGDEASRVARFVEKPDRAAAAALVSTGCLWNSGIFAWRAADYLTEVGAHTPELSAALDTLSPAEGGTDDLARRAARFFGEVRGTLSVDVGVLERSSKVIVVPGRFGWSDVGTWGALREVRSRDDAGNAVHGVAHLVESQDNVVHAAEGRVVLYGVRDLVVVVRDGVTLVTTVEQSADLKTMLDALPAALKGTP